MAKIIDFAAEMRKRFFAWASEYLKIPTNIKYTCADIITFLVEKKVFTLDEIRKELCGRKIVLHESVFNAVTEYFERRKSDAE